MFLFRELKGADRLPFLNSFSVLKFAISVLKFAIRVSVTSFNSYYRTNSCVRGGLYRS